MQQTTCASRDQRRGDSCPSFVRSAAVECEQHPRTARSTARCQRREDDDRSSCIRSHPRSSTGLLRAAAVPFPAVELASITAAEAARSLRWWLRGLRSVDSTQSPLPSRLLPGQRPLSPRATLTVVPHASERPPDGRNETDEEGQRSDVGSERERGLAEKQPKLGYTFDYATC
jgi:hypothetical protein